MNAAKIGSKLLSQTGRLNLKTLVHLPSTGADDAPAASATTPATPPTPVAVQAVNAVGRGVWSVVGAASVAVSTYHGYRRNNGSVGWAIGWGLLGGIFPIITPAVAVAQGLGKPKY